MYTCMPCAKARQALISPTPAWQIVEILYILTPFPGGMRGATLIGSIDFHPEEGRPCNGPARIAAQRCFAWAE